MTYPQPENTDTIVATEEKEFHPAEEVRILRQELAERLAMLKEQYAVSNSIAKESVKEVDIPVRHTFQEHLEAAITAISLLQPKSVHKSVVVHATESVETKITKTEITAENRLLSVLKGMNSVLVTVGVLGLLWAILYYLRGDDISQVGLPLAVAGLGLITVGISGRMIQDYINRLNYSAVH